MGSINLKRANDKDLSLINDILKKNDLVYEDIKDNTNIKLFSAYDDNLFIGIIGLEQFRNVGFLRSFVVLDEYRDKGYGKKIYNSLFNYAKSKGVKEIYLLTTTAENFFKKLGFKTLERKDVPQIIKNTAEFSHFCPDTAICMKINLQEHS